MAAASDGQISAAGKIPAKPRDSNSCSEHSFTDQITSFFNNPNITSLWTNNTLFAWIMLLMWIFVGMVAGKTMCDFITANGFARLDHTH